ncbi:MULTISPECIES: hypothetical protein [Streptomyces]|uniref:Uncharacterized protein n=1 Tax=Streptomyces nymphaeiformis TaxID=2663842 RepID=A0A7W7U748_9ACTN|nr:hypothetical protein [Streptomyces nymphaeiformis]MBB4986129.1 hypothetical protein [Streptomyces nymphaeiformis]
MRHSRLNSDAKLLLIYIQGLPESASGKPLGEHATDLGMRPRAYHRAKECLVACGFLHEWKFQTRRGYWLTEQLLSNVTLTRDEANAVRDGIPAESPDDAGPTARNRGPRRTGAQPPVDEDGEKKTSPHPPTEEPAAQQPEPDGDMTPEAAEAERLLLSLRHQNRDLLLGVREARGLAEAAAEWLRRGVSVADLRHALTAHLPRTGVRSAVGFLRHRLTEKLPVPLLPPTPQERPAEAARQGLVTCEGFGDEHVFRPVGDETHCGACRMELARRANGTQLREPAAGPSWRTRVDQVRAEGLMAAPSGGA